MLSSAVLRSTNLYPVLNMIFYRTQFSRNTVYMSWMVAISRHSHIGYIANIGLQSNLMFNYLTQVLYHHWMIIKSYITVHKCSFYIPYMINFHCINNRHYWERDAFSACYRCWTFILFELHYSFRLVGLCCQIYMM